MTTPVIEAHDFRTALGHFCTGVTVVTGMGGDDVPVGFACQSFSALSLDPPLVLFCPGNTSRAWPVIQQAGSFVVNLLAEDQRDLSTTFGSRTADKFAGVSWRAAESGAPILEGALGWIDCTIEAVHDGGDHRIVVGRVTTLGAPRPDRPLLFYRGRYTGTFPERGEAIPAGLSLDAFLTWPVGDDWL
ncbi:flavin reductase family protein [Tsukamurella sp. 8F]|uniref:3-hydroxy-9,10-secoandrosta-1,3,5(10)-triene-9, 17-dione monooxygenase reductase subunit n=1 Tax=unclassified Tsukamurella TaxID=2633480 RepID=UPI0023B91A59|nr:MULTISPECIES: 3-hydroxy-9,10-secoandrosta-1,3,5(10)-triene-9,17-dione monooxygenase reductase subunit [unclassified Tsukamurella]MDF0530716.1 flavin reductase family protein [Tsukamurella sp. 8J]MDF0587917.1 flavin reductase family protein [Tsukamurella sp. 8F]